MASATATLTPTASRTAALTLANVLYEKKGEIALVTVNRPKVLNALNTPTWKDLRTAFEKARADAEALYSYEGTYQMQNLIVGKAVTGLSAFI